MNHGSVVIVLFYVQISKMLPSVKERKRNANKFHMCYEDLCKVQNLMPLPAVMAHGKKNALCLNGDRLTYKEWGPILNALSQDRSLQFIGVRSKCTAKIGTFSIQLE
jgi:centrosomal protein CEP78